jgi:hypothetical protein
MSTENTYHISDDGNGCYSLHVDNSEMVSIIWHHGVRSVMWRVHGPADLKQSVTLMKGFIHLTALLSNEKQVPKPPVKQVVETLNMKENHGISKKQSRSPRFSRRGKGQS